MFSTSNPATYQMISDALWPLKLLFAIICAYLGHEYVREHIIHNDDDDEPDCPA